MDLVIQDRLSQGSTQDPSRVDFAVCLYDFIDCIISLLYSPVVSSVRASEIAFLMNNLRRRIPLANLSGLNHHPNCAER